MLLIYEPFTTQSQLLMTLCQKPFENMVGKGDKRAMMALDRSPKSFSPQMNLCTNLVDVHKEMLKTKYQISVSEKNF